MAFWRMGEAILAFSLHKSFNFVGLRHIRSQLRRLRSLKVGETLFVGIMHNGGLYRDRSGFRTKTSKKPFIDYFGKPATPRWVCRHHDVVRLLNSMKYECPRCCSSDRPRRLYPEFLRNHHDVEMAFASKLLCDDCVSRESARDRNRFAAAAQEIAVAQREIKHLQRLAK